MATIDKKSIIQFLDDGMDNPLPDWFKPFGQNPEEQKKKFILRDAGFGLGPAKRPDNWPQNVIPLAYVLGNINCVPMPSRNCVVISSQFSGCLMAAFTCKDDKIGDGFITNQKYVCHIAIEDRMCGNECESVFNNAQKDEKISDVRIFNPASIIPAIEKRNTFAQAAAGYGYDVNFKYDVYGLISGDNECFSFIVGRKSGTKNTHVLSYVEWADDNSIKNSYSLNMHLEVFKHIR